MCMESRGYRVVGIRRILGLIEEVYSYQVHACKCIQPGKNKTGTISSASVRYDGTTNVTGMRNKWMQACQEQQGK